MALDPIYTANLVFCTVILLLGYWGYRKKSDDRTSLFIGIAFGLFGISHLATLLGLRATLGSALLIIRTIGYLTAIYAVYNYWR
jgi:hypothetical protein